MRPRAIVTDVEGTTTSPSFVSNVLFPYARERIAAHVAAHLDDCEVRRILDDVRARTEAALSDDKVIDVLLRWADEDRKIAPLKTLQGHIWREGYCTGALRGHVYDDAVAALRAWSAAGVRLYVYSSGSVEAQRLLFAHAAQGDLAGLFAGHFDTNFGPKVDASSYRAIAAAIGLAATDVLFLSDSLAELDAARAAGMATTLVDRDARLAREGEHPRVITFEELAVP